MNDGMVQVSIVQERGRGVGHDRGGWLVWHVPRVGELMQLPEGCGEDGKVSHNKVRTVLWEEPRPGRRQLVTLVLEKLETFD